MKQDVPDTLSQPSKQRIALAREIVERKKQELGQPFRPLEASILT